MMLSRSSLLNLLRPLASASEKKRKNFQIFIIALRNLRGKSSRKILVLSINKTVDYASWCTTNCRPILWSWDVLFYCASSACSNHFIKFNSCLVPFRASKRMIWFSLRSNSSKLLKPSNSRQQRKLNYLDHRKLTFNHMGPKE